MPLAKDMRTADHLVVDDRTGLLHIDKKERLTLVTRTGKIKLKPETVVRQAMPRDRAMALFAALATPGSNATLGATTLEEVAFECTLSLRVVQAIIRRCNGEIDTPVGPDAYTDHDYLGSFDVTGEIVVADRQNVGGTANVIAVPATPGRWHAFLRYEAPEIDTTIAMFAVHEDHVRDVPFDGEEIGTFGVTSRCALIADAGARARAEMFKEDRVWDEGIVEDLACLAYTVSGKGMYTARAHVRDGRATVVRLGLRTPEDSLFKLPPPPPSAAYTKAFEADLAEPGADARPYSAKTTFAAGDKVTHPTFGDGVVTEALPDRKVEIAFRTGPRTLVHGR